MGGGIIAAVTSAPTTSLTMIMHNGAGTGMMPSDFAAGVTVSLSGGTTYQIDEDSMDVAELPFTPVFDQTHICVGQSVMPISSSGMMSGGMGGGMAGARLQPRKWNSNRRDSAEPPSQRSRAGQSPVSL